MLMVGLLVTEDDGDGADASVARGCARVVVEACRSAGGGAVESGGDPWAGVGLPGGRLFRAYRSDGHPGAIERRAGRHEDVVFGIQPAVGRESGGGWRDGRGGVAVRDLADERGRAGPLLVGSVEVLDGAGGGRVAVIGDGFRRGRLEAGMFGDGLLLLLLLGGGVGVDEVGDGCDVGEGAGDAGARVPGCSGLAECGGADLGGGAGGPTDGGDRGRS